MSKQPTIDPQAKRFRQSARIALVRRDLTIGTLAELIGFPRSSVSKAINQGVFPKIRARIAEELGLAA